jgi:dynein assembly factor 5
VQALLPELLPPVLKGLREWTTDRRLQAAQLLHTIAVLGEDSLAEHMPRTVAALCNAAGEDDAEIAQRIVAAVHVIGAVVAPAGWLPSVLEHAEGAKAPPSQRANALVVLGGLLHGARAAAGGLSIAELSAVTSVVTSEGVRGADHVGVRRQMLSVVANVVDLCGPQCGGVARELYLVLLQLQAARADPELQRRAAAAAEALAAACGLPGGAADLCAAHSEALLDALAARSGEWADDSPDRLVFAALLRSCPPEELGRRMGRLVGILRGCLEPERDGKLRIATLQLLDELLDSPTQRDAFRGHAPALLREALLPPLVWQVGKVAAAVRFHAIVALGSLLRHRLASGADLEAALAWDRPALLPNLHSALEEDHYADSRLAACHAAEELLRALGEAGSCLTYEQCRAVYPELTKRLDDSEDRVRLAATRTISAFYSAMGGLDATNVGYLLKGMLIHMDDANAELQEAVCAAVEELARMHPAVVRAEVGLVRDKHRYKHFCDRCLAAAAAAEAEGD